LVVVLVVVLVSRTTAASHGGWWLVRNKILCKMMKPTETVWNACTSSDLLTLISISIAVGGNQRKEKRRWKREHLDIWIPDKRTNRKMAKPTITTKTKRYTEKDISSRKDKQRQAPLDDVKMKAASSSSSSSSSSENEEEDELPPQPVSSDSEEDDNDQASPSRATDPTSKAATKSTSTSSSRLFAPYRSLGVISAGRGFHLIPHQ